MPQDINKSDTRTPQQKMAETIIAGLKDGTSPLINISEADAVPAPVNHMGMRFNGINRLVLSHAGHNDDPRWISKKQCEENGFVASENAQPQTLMFWIKEKQVYDRDRDGNKVLGADGLPQLKTVQLKNWELGFFEVYHFSEVKNSNGQDLPAYVPPVRDFIPMEEAQTLIANSEANIETSARVGHPQYNPYKDTIVMPPREDYISEQYYNSAVLTQVAYSIGRDSRLDLPVNSTYYESEKATLKGLQTSVASLFLTQDLGLPSIPPLGIREASTVKATNEWVRVLSDNPQILFKACVNGEMIKNYALDYTCEPDHRFHQQAARDKEAAKAEREAKNADFKLAAINGLIMSPEEELADALTAAGFDLDGEPPDIDGERHELPIIGDETGKTGVYQANKNDKGKVSGWFRNGATKEYSTWVYSGQQIKKDKLAEIKAETSEMKALVQEKAIREARFDLFRNANALYGFNPEDNYLQKQGVYSLDICLERPNSDYISPAFGDIEKKAVLIPAYDKDGQIKNVQSIRLDGSKSFAPGCPTSGLMHIIAPEIIEVKNLIHADEVSKHRNIEIIKDDDGEIRHGLIQSTEQRCPEALKDIAASGEILIADDYINGASLHLATQKPVVVAFDVKNVLSGARSVRETFPESKITICATEKTSSLIQEAAKAVGADVVTPKFSKKEIGQGLESFNDLHKARGLEAIAKIVGQRKDQKVENEQKNNKGVGR